MVESRKKLLLERRIPIKVSDLLDINSLQSVDNLMLTKSEERSPMLIFKFLLLNN